MVRNYEEGEDLIQVSSEEAKRLNAKWHRFGSDRPTIGIDLHKRRSDGEFELLP